jgi:hypothetical protein
LRKRERNKDIVGGFGWGFAFRKGERQVGETGENPSIHGCRKSPPQAVENRKISVVPKWPKIAHFSAGSPMAEKGNRLV